MKQIIFIATAIFLFTFCGGNKYEENEFLLNHLKECNKYLGSQNAFEVGSVVSAIGECSGSEELHNLEEQLKALRTYTHFTADSIFSSGTMEQVISHYERYLSHQKRVNDYDAETGIDKDKDNLEQQSLDVLQYIIANKLLLLEMEVRRKILRNWAIDCDNKYQLR